VRFSSSFSLSCGACLGWNGVLFFSLLSFIGTTYMLRILFFSSRLFSLIVLLSTVTCPSSLHWCSGIVSGSPYFLSGYQPCYSRCLSKVSPSYSTVDLTSVPCTSASPTCEFPSNGSYVISKQNLGISVLQGKWHPNWYSKIELQTRFCVWNAFIIHIYTYDYALRNLARNIYLVSIWQTILGICFLLLLI
jgi:hypothetical protein